MGTPYLGEIRMVGFSFAPQGWAACNGQLVPISENDALFALIGTTYGGDGQQTFRLPDLMGRIPVHAGSGQGGITYTLGESGGVEQVTLIAAQIPAHSHTPMGQSAAGDQRAPGNGVWAMSNLAQYNNIGTDANMAPQAIGSAGGSQPHSNMMPYTVITFCIALFGIFPSEN